MERKLYSVRKSSADFNASDFSVKYYLIVIGAVSHWNIASLSASRMLIADVFSSVTAAQSSKISKLHKRTFVYGI